MKKIIMQVVKFGTLAAVVLGAVLVVGSLSGGKLVRVANAAVKPAVVPITMCGETSGSGVYVIAGTYGGVWTGTLDGQQYDAALVGAFSGAGGYTGHLVYSIGGSSATTAVSGTYTVSNGTEMVDGVTLPTCAGTLTITSFSPNLSFALVFLPSQSEVKLVEADGVGLMADTQHQIYSTCGEGNTEGTYTGEWNGTLGGHLYNALEVTTLTGTGSSSTGASGTMAGTLAFSLGGTSGVTTDSGTYSVSNGTLMVDDVTLPNCTGILTVPATSNTPALEFAVIYIPSNYELMLAEIDGNGTMSNTETHLGFPEI